MKIQWSLSLNVINLVLNKEDTYLAINRRITLINESLSIRITALTYTFHEQQNINN